MKRVFATAAILAMLVMTGAALAVNPTRADNSTSPAAAPNDFVFAQPVNASNTGYTKPAVLGANSTGGVHAPFSGTDNTTLIDSFNRTLGAPFSNVQLDSSGSLVGSERTVSDSQGRVHMAWFHGQGSNVTIYYGRNDPGAGNQWYVREIPGSFTYPGFKVIGIARGETVGAFDRIWVMWARNGVGARVSSTTDGGVTWSPVEGVPGPFNSLSTDFNIGATTSGYLFVGWFDRSPNDILVEQRSPSGAWGGITDISRRPNDAQDYTPRFATAPDGGLRAAWSSVSTDAFYREWSPTTGWSPFIIQLFSTPGSGNSRALEIVTDPNGVNHLVWDDDTGRGEKNVTVYYIRGAGENWTAPQAVFPQFGSATTRYPYDDVGRTPNGSYAVHIVGNSFIGGPSDNYYTWTDAGGGGTPFPTATVPPVTPTPCSANVYSDVPPADPFYPFIYDLSLRGAVSGYADCTFRPYNNITRGQISKVIMLAYGYQLIAPPNPTFADVPYGSAFYSYIEAASAAGIIAGYNCGTVPTEPCDAQRRPYFRPNANVTRGQITKMVVLARHWTLHNPTNRTFADVLPGTAFYETIETAVAHGIISGYACGGPGEPCDAQQRRYFRQNNSSTRGQGAKIIDLAIYSNDPTATPVRTATRTATPAVTSTAVPATATEEPATSTAVSETATVTGTSAPATATNTSVPSTATVTSTP